MLNRNSYRDGLTTDAYRRFNEQHLPVNSMTKRILLIDDEAPLRRITQLTLKITANWEVIVAESGQEGLEQAEAMQPDAILLDLMMPQMDGMATLRRLQQNPTTRQIPVIILTAKAQALYQFQYEGLEATAIFIKPFDPVNLAQQIREALNWS